MARMEIDGLDDLELSLKEIADLPESVLLGMLEAEGQVIRSAQERRLQGLGFGEESTGQLAGSIDQTHRLKRDSKGVPGITVYPKGVRRDGKTRNAEVGFILEYGAPMRGIAPRQWMRVANEEAAGEAASAAARVYDAWLKSKGL